MYLLISFDLPLVKIPAQILFGLLAWIIFYLSMKHMIPKYGRLRHLVMLFIAAIVLSMAGWYLGFVLDQMPTLVWILVVVDAMASMFLLIKLYAAAKRREWRLFASILVFQVVLTICGLMLFDIARHDLATNKQLHHENRQITISFSLQNGCEEAQQESADCPQKINWLRVVSSALTFVAVIVLAIALNAAFHKNKNRD